MGKVLVVYFSVTGKTKTMAEFIAEGVRFTGNEVEIKKINEIKDAKEMEGYDAYAFGCPTYHRDMTENMKTFLFLAKNANLGGKVGAAFGSHTHSGDAPKIIFDTMEHVYGMKMVNLGYLLLKENQVGTQEGNRACQDYGRAIGSML
ncbi:MAG: flavodoxin domain-containing protein [bacterium]